MSKTEEHKFSANYTEYSKIHQDSRFELGRERTLESHFFLGIPSGNKKNTQIIYFSVYSLRPAADPSSSTSFSVDPLPPLSNLNIP